MNDITAAKTADICVAHIDTHGRVEYCATTPRPWPWQPPAPRSGSRSGPRRGRATPKPPRTVDNAAPAEDLGSHDTQDAVRHDAIAAFIRGADPEQSADVLAKLTLLGGEGDEDQHLTARFLGTAGQSHSGAYRTDLLRAGQHRRGRPHRGGTRRAFARTETCLYRNVYERKTERQICIRLLADHTASSRADHVMSPGVADGEALPQ